jgi:hypothetical protein
MADISDLPRLHEIDADYSLARQACPRPLRRIESVEYVHGDIFPADPGSPAGDRRRARRTSREPESQKWIGRCGIQARTWLSGVGTLQKSQRKQEGNE